MILDGTACACVCVSAYSVPAYACVRMCACVCVCAYRYVCLLTARNGGSLLYIESLCGCIERSDCCMRSEIIEEELAQGRCYVHARGRRRAMQAANAGLEMRRHEYCFQWKGHEAGLHEDIH